MSPNERREWHSSISRLRFNYTAKTKIVLFSCKAWELGGHKEIDRQTGGTAAERECAPRVAFEYQQVAIELNCK